MRPIDVVQFVSDKTGVSVSDIYSGSRLRDIVAARVECYEMLRSMGYSFPKIGEAMGRDHSTIIVMLKKRAKTKAASAHETGNQNLLKEENAENK